MVDKYEKSDLRGSSIDHGDEDKPEKRRVRHHGTAAEHAPHPPNRRPYVNATCAAWPIQRPQSTSLSPVRHKVGLNAIFLQSHRGRYLPDGLFDRIAASRRSGGVLVECARWRMRRCFLLSDDFETSPILSKRKDTSIVAIVGSVQEPWSSIIPVRLPSVRYKASCRKFVASTLRLKDRKTLRKE